MSTRITNYDTTKIFLGGNRTKTATYTNSSGSTVTLAPGRVLGRVFASNKVAIFDKDNTDGSQFPMGVCMSYHEVPNGSSVTVTFCYAGDIDRTMLIFNSGESLASTVTTTYTDSGTDTVAVAYGTVEDLLTARTHINLVGNTEIYGYDNQPA